MEFTIRCLMLTCAVAIIGVASQTPQCPKNWPGYPNKCELVNCNKTAECTHSGFKGSCCLTSCGGQACFFETVKIKRQTAFNNSNFTNNCPSMEWLGLDLKLCKHRICFSDDQCYLDGLPGNCCPTKCGGQNCHFLTPGCPVNWNGLGSAFCSLQLCTSEIPCIDNTGKTGICCETSCLGHNCFAAP